MTAGAGGLGFDLLQEEEYIYILTCHYIHIAYGTYLASYSVDTGTKFPEFKMAAS